MNRRALFLMMTLLSCATCADRPSVTQPPQPRPTTTTPTPTPTTSAPTASSSAGTGAPFAGPPAPFVVALVVDQLSAWVAEERLPLLPKTGGFARLRREGIWAKTVRLPYASTDTAPGHAALHTGKVPAESGIWGNELPDPASTTRITFLRDATTQVVTPEGVRTDRPGSSAARLRVDNVADRLRAAHPDATIVSISIKDRGAIMPGGKKPTIALWYDSALGTFVTSTAFATSIPSWAAKIANARAVEEARARPWTVADMDWLERATKVPAIVKPTKDDAPGEGDLDGLGITFPHVAKTHVSFRAVPANDEMILDLALAAVTAMHDPRKPTLLALSMSACDVIGHVFGPDSWEAWDHLYRLDAALGRFFDELERRLGANGFAVVLGADHGNSSIPEAVKARRPTTCDVAAVPPRDSKYDRPICFAGTRIEPNELRDDLRAEVAKAVGPPRVLPLRPEDWITGVADPYVFLSEQGRSADPALRAKIDDAVKRVFERRRRIVKAIDVRELATKCPGVLAKAAAIPNRAAAGEDMLTLVCRSWAPNLGAGDWYMVPELGHVFDGEIVPNKGASHGGPHLYDRTIPFLVRSGGGVGLGTDAGAVIEDPVDFTVYSEVLASLLGLRSSGGSDPKSPPKNVTEIIEGLRVKPPAKAEKR